MEKEIRPPPPSHAHKDSLGELEQQAGSFFFFSFKDRVMLCSTGWLGTHLCRPG